MTLVRPVLGFPGRGVHRFDEAGDGVGFRPGQLLIALCALFFSSLASS